MSNLGYAFLGAGFFDEAQAEAKKASAIERHHESVPGLLKRLKETHEKEDGKLKETLDKVKEKAAFFRRAADQILKPRMMTIAPKWKSPEAILDAKIEGDSIYFSGDYLRSENPFGLLVTPPPHGTVMTKHRITFSGRIQGHVIFGDVKRSSNSGPVTSLLGIGNDAKAMMAFNEDQSELRVAEAVDRSFTHFYSLTRVS